MAKIIEWTEKQRREWDKWVANRPAVIQELCRRLPGDRLYRLKSYNQRVTLCSYSEDGTVTVIVSGKYNFVTFDRKVFGISPDDLEECDLPDPEELIGTVFTEKKDIYAFIEAEMPIILAGRKRG